MEFTKLNKDFDAEPNAPYPRIEIDGMDLTLKFTLNSDNYEDPPGTLIFIGVHKYRLGPTNDEGFYRGQCRFSNTGIEWGDFYEIRGDNWQYGFPEDVKVIKEGPTDDSILKHYLFYFRDETFECIATSFRLEEEFQKRQDKAPIRESYKSGQYDVPLSQSGGRDFEIPGLLSFLILLACLFGPLLLYSYYSPSISIPVAIIAPVLWICLAPPSNPGLANGLVALLVVGINIMVLTVSILVIIYR